MDCLILLESVVAIVCDTSLEIEHRRKCKQIAECEDDPPPEDVEARREARRIPALDVVLITVLHIFAVVVIFAF